MGVNNRRDTLTVTEPTVSSVFHCRLPHLPSYSVFRTLGNGQLDGRGLNSVLLLGSYMKTIFPVLPPFQ